MLWVQALASFAVWLGGGWLIARRIRNQSRLPFSKLPRAIKAAGGALLLILGAGILLGALFALGPKAFPAGGMSLLSWLIVSVAGFAFVGMQCLALLLLVSMLVVDVTKGDPPSSRLQDSGGIQEP